MGYILIDMQTFIINFQIHCCTSLGVNRPCKIVSLSWSETLLSYSLLANNLPPTPYFTLSVSETDCRFTLLVLAAINNLE